MQIFIMHIGHPGNVDVRYTVSRRRHISEIFGHLPNSAPEKEFFAEGSALYEEFPSGEFNCWGVPSRAEPAFVKTQIGDLVLIVPSVGVHREAGVKYLGQVKALCPFKCDIASQILWPATPNDRLFPFIFFFDTEVGHRGWFEFLEDLGISERWHPRGYYRRLNSERFNRWGGPAGYLDFLRSKCGFKTSIP